jgi:transposase-like protein
MSEISCKGCGAADYVKNGKVRGLQRYRCRQCGCNFTDTRPRGKPAALKALTLLLYGMGNMSYRMIGRLLGVSHVSIYQWIQAEAGALPEPEVPAEVAVVNLDEMWHFLKKRLQNSGFGELMTLCVGAPSPGCWVAVMMQPANAFSTRSVSTARRSSPTIGRAFIASSRRINSLPAKT